MSTLIEVSQLDQWFRKNQPLIQKCVIGLLALGALYAVYNSQKHIRLEEASALLAAVQAGDEEGNSTKLEGAAQQLQQKYPDTHHAAFAMLQLARYQASQSQWKASEASARWIIEKGTLPVLTDQARLHLAQLQIQAKQWDTALATLKKPFSEPPLEVLASELIADIFAIKGDISRAQNHYKKALDAQPAGHPYRELIEHKISTLVP